MKHCKNILVATLLSAATFSAHALETTVDFDSYTNIGIGSTMPSLTEGNVTFTGSGDYSSFFIDNLGIDIGGDFSGNYLVNGFQGFTTLTMSFATAVNQFSFNLGDNQNDWELTGFDSSGLSIGSLIIDKLISPEFSNQGTRFGLSAIDSEISYATLSQVGSGPFGLSDEIEFDNLKYTTTAVSPVPEPSTYALMLGGLGMVGFMAYRRRKIPNA